MCVEIIQLVSRNGPRQQWKIQKIEHIYYYCAYEYLKLRSQKKTKNDIKRKLGFIYGGELANEIIDDFSDKKNISKYFNLPNCFECNSCKLKNYCLLEKLINFDTQLHKLKENNLIDQKKLKQFF